MRHADDRHRLAMASAMGGELSSRPAMSARFFTGAQRGLERQLQAGGLEEQRLAAQQKRSHDFLGRRHHGGQVNVPRRDERSLSPAGR